MTSKLHTHDVATLAVDIPTGMPAHAWYVKGRGKTATYGASIPNGIGKRGELVALVAKSGAVTFGHLGEIIGPDDKREGHTAWTFERDRSLMTADVQRANRAAKSQASAAYWSSDAGKATADRIAARQERRASEVTTTHDPAIMDTPTPAPADDSAAQTVAMLVAAGASPDVIAATLAALGLAAPTAPTAPAKSKPRKVTSTPTVDTGTAERCDVCDRSRRHCEPHTGATELTVVCPQCRKLPAKTARTRAARHK